MMIMINTTLFRVEASADGFSEPLIELVRAGSPTSAARTVYRFWTRELNEPLACRRLSVQLLSEPDGEMGVIYECALREIHFSICRGRVVPARRRRQRRRSAVA